MRRPPRMPRILTRAKDLAAPRTALRPPPSDHRIAEYRGGSARHRQPDSSVGARSRREPGTRRSASFRMTGVTPRLAELRTRRARRPRTTRPPRVILSEHAPPSTHAPNLTRAKDLAARRTAFRPRTGDRGVPWWHCPPQAARFFSRRHTVAQHQGMRSASFRMTGVTPRLAELSTRRALRPDRTPSGVPLTPATNPPRLPR